MPVLISNNTSPADQQYGNWVTSQPGSPSLSREQFNAISMNIYNRVNETDLGRSAWDHVGRWALGTAIDLADTVWSTPLNPMGERGDVWAMASPEQREYYERHKGLIEGSSALAGGVLTAIAAEALVIPRIANALASSTAIAGSAAWRAAEAWNINTRVGMLAAQRAAAAGGESFSMLGSSAGRHFLANRAVAGAAVATRTVPIDYAVMWNNESFNSGEFSKEGFWIGVGAALGGAVGAVGARALVRQTANSQAIRDIRSQPMALSGVSNDLLSPEHLDMSRNITPAHAQLKESAYTTEYLLASRSANPNGYDEAARNASMLDNVRDQYRGFAIDSTQKITQQGIAGVETLKLPAKSFPEIQNIVDNIAKQDPLVLHGVAEMGVITQPIKKAKETRAAHIDSLFKQAELMSKQGNVREAQRLARLQRVLKNRSEFILVDGTWMRPESELAQAVAEFNPDHIVAKLLPTKGEEGLVLNLPGKGKVTLDAALSPTDGRGLKIDVGALPIKDRLALNEAAGTLVRKLTAKDAKTQFRLDDKSAGNWFSLDLASEILERGGKIDWATTNLKLRTIDDLKRESVRLKARGLLAEAGPTGRITDEMRFRYNLPSALPMERLEDSAGDGFRRWLQGAARDQGDLREVSQALTDSRVVQGIDLLPPSGSPTARIDGNMLRFNRSHKGDWMRPMLGYFDKDSLIQKVSEGAHRDAITLRKAESTAILVKGNQHVNHLAANLVQSPELAKAMDIKGLHDDQITGLGNAVGQAAGELLPKRFRVRDNETLLAASKLQEATEKHGMANYKGMMDSVQMQDEITKITSTGNSATRVMLDQYASIRSGWDIDDLSPLGDGLYGFRLADTETNRYRLGMDAAEEWTDQFLMNERIGKMVAVNDDAARIIGKFGQLTESLRASDNTLRAAKGLDEIKAKKFYTPPPDTKGALVGFVFGPDDKLVPGRTIVARSQQEWDNLYNRTLDELGRNDGYKIKTRDQLSNLRDIWDDAQMDWIDPGMHAAGLGLGQQKGGLVGAYVKEGAFMEMLDWVRRKSIAQSQDTLKQLMHEPLLVARAQGAAERGVNPKKGRNIFDEYEKLLTGNSAMYAQTAMGDRVFRVVEESVDRALANTTITAPARYFTDLAQRMGMNPTDLSGKKTYKDIAKVMGPYTPFNNAAEYIESRGVRRPPTVRAMATQLNTIAASVLLRWFEVPHAAMNLLGLITTIPATVTAGRAPISTFMNIKGQDVGVLDGGRIIANAMKDMYTKRSAADWNYMVKMGDSGQSVMEYHQQLGAIQSQAGFMKWLKQADKWASIATDTTENWSRQFSHFVGLRLADYHGIQGMAARHDFAREIANSAIADYAPVNRPELFGSGFGSLFGLFQSYALNHYTKMFRWMEQGQFKQFGLQAGVQATMFGLPGTYGMGYLFDLRDSMLSSSGSDPTAIDLIYESFGPVLGGAIVHGGVSQVSQLAMWSRGDTNFRVPGASGNVPALDVGTKVARGFVDAVSSYVNAMPDEGAHAMLEAVQRNMPNRVMRSWLTLLNGGQEVDAYGQTMTNTREWMDVVARSVGLRSARQQSELEAFYASRAGMERDAGRMETLRESFRSAVRRSNGDVEQVNPVQYFNDFVAAGGNPKMFKTWVTNLIRDTSDARSAQQLKKSLTTPKSALELWRYSAYGAWGVN